MLRAVHFAETVFNLGWTDSQLNVTVKVFCFIFIYLFVIARFHRVQSFSDRSAASKLVVHPGSGPDQFLTLIQPYAEFPASASPFVITVAV